MASRVAEHKSRGVPEDQDPRTAKTRGAITSAFFQLLARRPYGRIRVSDITRKAQVGRATFYAHFASKDALLKSELDRVIVPMLVASHGNTRGIDCTRLFAHILQGRTLYGSVMAGSTRVITERLVQDALEARVRALIAAGVVAAPETAVFVPRFVASTILALLAWSLEQAASPTPASLQDAFRSLVGGAIA
jgi:AcrR family transcriptional regulator